jgi:hypothetical protein
MSSIIIIDNCFVMNLPGNGVSVGNVDRLKKIDKNLDIELLPKLTLGSIKLDNSLLSHSIAGTITFNDLKHLTVQDLVNIINIHEFETLII